MARTWEDIQRETLQLMRSFTQNGNSLWSDTDNLDYVNAMAEAANYALRDLAAEASPLVRMCSLYLNPVPNMLGDGPSFFEPQQCAGQDITFQAMNPKAFYFEVDKPATVHLQALGQDGQWNDLKSFAYPPDHQGFVAYKGKVETADGAPVAGSIRLRFVGGTTYNLRNVAFYALPFGSANDVPPFTRYDRYDLRKLTANQPGNEFMRLAPNNAVQQSTTSYLRSDNFRWEGDSTIVFDHYAKGQWDIFYYAYPTPIVGPYLNDATTANPNATRLDFVPELATEALDLVPLYIASRLYTEEKPDLCSLYFAQYMARRAELTNRTNATGTTEFVSESGWV